VPAKGNESKYVPERNEPERNEPEKNDVVVWTPGDNTKDPMRFLPVGVFVLFIFVVMHFASTKPKVEST
jgi:hypothetical protein